MNALVVVDVQNDFMPGGALAVPEGDLVVDVANELMPRYPLVVATQDWHPDDHDSFAANHPGRSPGEVIRLAGQEQILWPVHCVEETRGAEFVLDLETDLFARVFRKGTDPRADSYSGFFDNGGRRATGLEEFLRGRGVTEVHVLGLATDHCVKFTALDAVRLGFETAVIEDGCRGVELKEGDVQAALDELLAAGVTLLRSDEIAT